MPDITRAHFSEIKKIACIYCLKCFCLQLQHLCISEIEIDKKKKNRCEVMGLAIRQKRKDFEYTWPSSLQTLLTGMNTKGKFQLDTHYVEICGPKLLWRIILEPMRPCWIEEIQDFSIHG